MKNLDIITKKLITAVNKEPHNNSIKMSRRQKHYAV
jgi:hypothetical protein